MGSPLWAASAAVVGVVLVIGVYGTMAGAVVGLAEAARLPAVVLAVALICLRQGAGGLRGVALWSVIGVGAALALRGILAGTGGAAWLPSNLEEPGTADLLLDAAWLCALAVLALRGRDALVSGPMLAAIIATTRIGTFVDLPASLVRETAASGMPVTTLAAFGAQVLAGVLAAGLVIAGSGWALALFSRAASRIVAPAMLLGAVGLVAALARAWQMIAPSI